VSEEKQIFRCFGCGVGGDIFKFVMQVEQLSFPEAVRFIAERHGIVLPQPAARPESESGSDTETLRRVMEEAGLFFHQTLLEQEEGRSPWISAGEGGNATVHRPFSLGYAPAGGGDLLAKFSVKDSQ